VATIEPFPNPEVPDIDSAGIMVPPWIKFPNLPFGSIGWRMGAGEYYYDRYAEWYQSQNTPMRKSTRKKYLEPRDWSGCYARLRWMRASRERYRAGVMGALLGDALGVPFEFKHPEDIPALSEINLVMPASFARTHSAIPYGTWSDDGAQLLCLLEVLQEEEEFSPTRFAELLIKWSREDYHQAGGIVFDCGGQTAQSIRKLEAGVAPIEAGGTGERSNGNGALMRCLPVAIAGHLEGWGAQEIAVVAHAQSKVTHGHSISQVCCALYSLMAASLLSQPEEVIQDCYRRAFAALTEVYAMQEFSEHTKALTLISDFPKTNFRRGSGYVVDTFWTAIDCLEKSDSYLIAVKAAVSYGNDTDTTACVAGGLAGIKYGLDYNNYANNPAGIPDDWVSALVVPSESARVIGCLR
jgi:ADP-ribosylglycohydrolase